MRVPNNNSEKKPGYYRFGPDCVEEQVSLVKESSVKEVKALRFSKRAGAVRHVAIISIVLAVRIGAHPAIAASSLSGPGLDESAKLKQSGSHLHALPGQGIFNASGHITAHTAACRLLHPHEHPVTAPGDDNGPWAAGDILSCEVLSKQISAARGVKPVILQVGIEALYKDAHIPDSIFAGPASDAEGLTLLKAKAKTIARTREVVIYCGCCPWKDCPNIRPAFLALRQMGFKNLKLLNIPTDFQQDWVNKGFPAMKS